MASSALERLVTAGLRASNESWRQLEAAVARLLDAPDIRRDERSEGAADAEGAGVGAAGVGRLFDTALARGGEASDRMSELVQREVARRADLIADRIDELEARVGALVAGDDPPAGSKPTPDEPGSEIGQESDGPDGSEESEGSRSSAKSQKAGHRSRSGESRGGVEQKQKQNQKAHQKQKRKRKADQKQRQKQNAKQKRKTEQNAKQEQKRQVEQKTKPKARKKQKHQQQQQAERKQGAEQKPDKPLDTETGAAEQARTGAWAGQSNTEHPQRREPVGTSGVRRVPTTRAAREGG
jgi:hypothetical protein